MKFFRVGNTVDDLPLYVKAATAAKAVDVVEKLTGPIPPAILKVTEIKEDELPEDEEFLE